MRTKAEDIVIYRYNRYPLYHQGSAWPFIRMMPKPLRLMSLIKDIKVKAAVNRIQKRELITDIVVKGPFRGVQLFSWII